MAETALETPSAYSPKEELANRLTHGFGLLLSIVAAFPLMALAARGDDVVRIGSAAVYGASLIMLFAASTLYHSAQTDARRTAFKAFDHCAIYVLIAGTYTPFLLVTMKGSAWSMPLFAIIWLLAAIGITLKVAFRKRFKAASVATYLFMGWLIVVAAQDVIQLLAPGGLYLVAAGGGFYTVGVLFYVAKRLPFNHAIWHMFVLGGSTCHFLAVFLYVMPEVTG